MALNINKDAIQEGLEKTTSIEGRMELFETKDNKNIVIDYAHTPDALLNCILSVREQFKLSKISIVFGCGGERDKPKRKIMGNIANKYCDNIYLTDDNPRNCLLYTSDAADE